MSSKLLVLLRHELRSVVRDQRTILLSVLLPLLLMPVLLLGQRKFEERQHEKAQTRTYAYAITGDADGMVAGLLAEPESADGLQLVREVVDDPEAALAAGELAVVVARGETDEGLPQIELRHRADNDGSRTAKNELERRFQDARRTRQDAMLADAGFVRARDEVLLVQTQDVASEAHAAGSKLGQILTALIVFLVVLGGQVAAADMLAGEKERGTLETLLTTAARRQDIIHAKLLTILIVAVVITAINLGNLVAYISLGFITGLEHLQAIFDPTAIAALALLLLPLTLVISGVLLLISGYARSFKEAQLFAVPIQLGALVPAMAAILPGLPLRSAIVLAPLANASVAVREVLSGRFDWPMIAAVTVVNLGLGLALARASVRALSEERLISATAADTADLAQGRPALERDIWKWVALGWGAFMLIALNFGELDLRLQLVINLVVLFAGMSLLIVRRYGLDPRQVFSLRAPPRAAWLAVVIGVPSGLLAAHGVSWLSGLVFPVPERVLQSFSDQLLPEGIPVWQLLILLSVTPGICEELFFRGTLLHALQRRYRPVVVCLLVGLAFGIFHVSLWRILPTGFLGVLFCTTVMLTRSIYPAMLWHALHNLTGVGLSLSGVDLSDIPRWTMALGIPGLALTFAILWRTREVEARSGAPVVSSAR